MLPDFELEDSTHLNDTDEVILENGLEFFWTEHLLIDGDKNKKMLGHLKYVAYNTAGRFIGEMDPTVSNYLDQ